MCAAKVKASRVARICWVADGLRAADRALFQHVEKRLKKGRRRPAKKTLMRLPGCKCGIYAESVAEPISLRHTEAPTRHWPTPRRWPLMCHHSCLQSLPLFMIFLPASASLSRHTSSQVIPPVAPLLIHFCEESSASVTLSVQNQ